MNTSMSLFVDASCVKGEHGQCFQAKECAKECMQPGIIFEHNNNSEW